LGAYGTGEERKLGSTSLTNRDVQTSLSQKTFSQNVIQSDRRFISQFDKVRTLVSASSSLL